MRVSIEEDFSSIGRVWNGYWLTGEMEVFEIVRIRR